MLIAEVDRTLNKAFFASRISGRRRDQTARSLNQDATLVSITEEVTGVATHPEDDLVLAAAVSTRADYLVTGDTQHRRLGRYLGVTIVGVTIVSPREFLNVLERQREEEERGGSVPDQ